MNARIFGRRFKAGDTVRTTMGVRMSGTVAPRHFMPREYTDGSYRTPLTTREWREAVPVIWTDGRRGWSFACHLAPA